MVQPGHWGRLPVVAVHDVGPGRRGCEGRADGRGSERRRRSGRGTWGCREAGPLGGLLEVGTMGLCVQAKCVSGPPDLLVQRRCCKGQWAERRAHGAVRQLQCRGQ